MANTIYIYHFITNKNTNSNNNNNGSKTIERIQRVHLKALEEVVNARFSFSLGCLRHTALELIEEVDLFGLNGILKAPEAEMASFETQKSSFECLFHYNLAMASQNEVSTGLPLAQLLPFALLDTAEQCRT